MSAADRTSLGRACGGQLLAPRTECAGLCKCPSRGHGCSVLPAGSPRPRRLPGSSGAENSAFATGLGAPSVPGPGPPPWGPGTVTDAAGAPSLLAARVQVRLPRSLGPAVCCPWAAGAGPRVCHAVSRGQRSGLSHLRSPGSEGPSGGSGVAVQLEGRSIPPEAEPRAPRGDGPAGVGAGSGGVASRDRTARSGCPGPRPLAR